MSKKQRRRKKSSKNHKPQPDSTIVIKYVESTSLDDWYVIPRNFKHSILRKRRKNEKFKSLFSLSKEESRDSSHLLGADIFFQVFNDDEKFQKLNPVKEIRVLDNVQCITFHTKFPIKKGRENVFSFVVVREKRESEYRLKRILHFDELGEIWRFMKRLKMHDGMYLRYYDKIHEGYTKILNFEKIPLQRTDKKRIKLMFQKPTSEIFHFSNNVNEEKQNALENYPPQHFNDDEGDEFIEEDGFIVVDENFIVKDQKPIYYFTEFMNLKKMKTIHFVFIDLCLRRKTLRRKGKNNNKKKQQQEVMINTEKESEEEDITIATDDVVEDDNETFLLSSPLPEIVNPPKQFVSSPPTNPSIISGSVEQTESIYDHENKKRRVLLRKSMKKSVRSGIPDNFRGSQWPLLFLKEYIKSRCPKNPTFAAEYKLEFWRIFEKAFSHYKDTFSIAPRIFPNFGGKIGVKNEEDKRKRKKNESENNNNTNTNTNNQKQEEEEASTTTTMIFNEKGFNRYKRLCVMISVKNSFLEFCPLISPILELLIMYIDSEVDIFGMIQGMIYRSVEDHWYFRVNKFQHALFFETFESLVDLKLPKLSKYFEKIEYDVLGFARKTFHRFFMNALPIHMVLRIFDSFLIEGYKVMYRTGLAILRFFREKILKFKNEEEMTDMILRHSREITDHEGFFKVLYGFSLKRKQFQKLDEENRETFDYGVLSGSSKGGAYIKPQVDIDALQKKLDNKAIIDDMKYWEAIVSLIPENLRTKKITILFSSEINGYSLKSLIRSTEEDKRIKQYVLLLEVVAQYDDIEDSKYIKKSATPRPKGEKHIIGAFIDADFADAPSRYFGGKETFIFSLKPEEFVFRSSGKNNYYVRKEPKKLSFGGGGEGAGLTIDDMLCYGSSYPCLTFQNNPLVTESVNFKITKAEMYVFL